MQIGRGWGSVGRAKPSFLTVCTAETVQGIRSMYGSAELCDSFLTPCEIGKKMIVTIIARTQYRFREKYWAKYVAMIPHASPVKQNGQIKLYYPEWDGEEQDVKIFLNLDDNTATLAPDEAPLTMAEDIPVHLREPEFYQGSQYYGTAPSMTHGGWGGPGGSGRRK